MQCLWEASFLRRRARFLYFLREVTFRSKSRMLHTEFKCRLLSCRAFSELPYRRIITSQGRFQAIVPGSKSRAAVRPFHSEYCNIIQLYSYRIQLYVLRYLLLTILFNDDIIDWQYFVWRYFAGDNFSVNQNFKRVKN